MDKNFKNMLIIFLGSFLLSLFSNTLSPFITTIKSIYNVSNGVIAMLPSVVYCASFLAIIICGKHLSLMGLKKGTYCGFLLMIAASIIIIFSKTFGFLIFGYFVSGISIGLGTLFNSMALSLLPREYQKFSAANACFGLGGILILPIDRFVLKAGIRFNYTYLIYIAMILIYIFIFSKVDGIEIPKAGSEDGAKSSFFVLKNPMVLMFLFAIFFYVGAEISTTSWTGRFLEKFYGMSRTDVPNILLGFWILFTLGRAVGDVILEKVGQLKYLIVSPIIAIAGIFVMLSGKSKLQAVLGMAIIGITISVIYPALQGYIVQHVKKEDIPPVCTCISTFNYFGATFLTYVIGFAEGIRIIYVFIIQIFFYLYIAFVSARYLLMKKTSY